MFAGLRWPIRGMERSVGTAGVPGSASRSPAPPCSAAGLATASRSGDGRDDLSAPRTPARVGSGSLSPGSAPCSDAVRSARPRAPDACAGTGGTARGDARRLPGNGGRLSRRGRVDDRSQIAWRCRRRGCVRLFGWRLHRRGGSAQPLLGALQHADAARPRVSRVVGDRHRSGCVGRGCLLQVRRGGADGRNPSRERGLPRVARRVLYAAAVRAASAATGRGCRLRQRRSCLTPRSRRPQHLARRWLPPPRPIAGLRRAEARRPLQRARLVAAPAPAVPPARSAPPGR